MSYYVSILLPLLLYLLFFSFVYDPGQAGPPPETMAEWFLFGLKLFWFGGILVALSNILGFLIYGRPSHRKDIQRLRNEGWDPSKLLVVVYVSRGDNVHALGRAIMQTKAVLEQYGANYRIDAVTDIPVADQLAHTGATFHLVPDSYQTKQGAKYKARALHYVTENHDIDGKTWILHLDEESCLHETALAGIHSFIQDPTNIYVIGQGEIQYNSHRYGSHFLITLIDCIRTGDDLGRFRLQYNLFRRPLFGMHGSYILIPRHIERKFGFDLGGKGSVTEDAYFALKCAESGVRFKWVNGYIQEQSPYTLKAILKQRRRWFCGLLYLSFDRNVALGTRFILLVNTLLWSVAWVGPIATITALLFPTYFPAPLLWTAAILQGMYAAIYVMGAWRNMEHLSMHPFRRIGIYLGATFLVPILSAVEGLAILYGLVRPVKTFDVVDKN